MLTSVSTSLYQACCQFFSRSPLCLTFIAFFLLFFGAACQSDSPTEEAPPARYGFKKINGYIRYMEQQRELQAELTFKTDSTTMIEDGVRLNQRKLKPKRLPAIGNQYRVLRNAVNFSDKYTYTYKEKDGSDQELSIALGKFEAPKIASDGLSREKGGILSWTGDPLTTNDGLILLFRDSEGKRFSVNHNGLTSGNTFKLVALQTERLAEGPATVQVTRKHTIVTQQESAAVVLVLEYYSRPIEFEVKP